VRLLFVSYNGTSDPLLHTQGVVYLERLPQRGVGVHLLTYERPHGVPQGERAARVHVRTEFARRGIIWHDVRYHKWPPILSTCWDIMRGWLAVWNVIRRYHIDVVHARGAIPAAIVAPVAWVTGTRWLFDLRGLVAEEYVDGGLWPRGGIVHRVVRGVERWLLHQARAVVVLTERAAEILRQNPVWRLREGVVPCVIPCCVDVDRFAQATASPEEARRLEASTGRPVLVYVGSLGTWYLFEEMVEFFQHVVAKHPEAQFLVVAPAIYHAQAYQAIRRFPGLSSQVGVRATSPEGVPHYLAAAHVGLSFIKPTFSKQFSSPTKIGEYLASGIPVVVNRGVGDLDRFVRQHQVGVVLPSFEPSSYQHGVTELFDLLADPSLPERCRQTAREHLSITVGRQRYWDVYQRLINGVEQS